MKLRSVVLLAGIAAVVAAVFASKAVLTSGPEWTAAQQAADSPVDVPPGAPTPGPTSTLIAPPEDAAPITEDEARQTALRSVQNSAAAGGTPPEIVSVVLVTARDVVVGDDRSRLRDHTRDYPVWAVSATGIFAPTRWRAVAEPVYFSTMTVYVDAVNGNVMSVSMSGGTE